MNSKKTAVVTGATKGIGRAITSELMDAGYSVFGSYQSDDATAEEAYRELTAASDSGLDFFKADFTGIDGVRSFVSHVKENTDHVDVIILNAGITCRKPFQEITYEDWNDVMNVNMTMPFFILQGLYDITAENGSVVAISSILGIYPHSVSIPYGVSKAGLNHIMTSMVKVYKEKNISVNAICPGFVETDWHKTKTPEHRASITRKISAGRFAETSELARFCMSVIANPYMTGSIIKFDGGYDYL